MDIKGHTVHKVLVESASDDRGGVLRLVPARPRESQPSSRCAPSRAAWRSRRSRSTRPRCWPASRSTRWSASTSRRPAASPRPGHLPDNALDGAADLLEKLWQVFVGEDATLVEVNPLILTADGQVVALDGKVTLDDNADFRHESARRAGRPERGRPAGAAGEGEGPELREARRQRRHHRQRRRPGHVDPRRRRLRR